MTLDKNWYTEEWAGQGSAISLKIKRKLHDEQSTYQRIEIFETEMFGRLMTLDGLVMVTDRDNFVYHEMMSHPALFTHPAPRRVLVIGGYLDQLHRLGEYLDAPIVEGSTSTKERERLFDLFRTGALETLVVSRVGNFSIDLPEAAVAIQVSGTFGSRQEEAQRLGRVLRPKSDGRQAHFYTVVARDTIDTEYAAHRQRFLAEQGYAYTIVDADDALSA